MGSGHQLAFAEGPLRAVTHIVDSAASALLRVRGDRVRAAGFVAAASMVLLLVRSRLRPDELGTPDSGKRRRKGKAKRNKEKIAELELAPHLERDNKTEYYELRRAASTLPAETVAWFQRHVDSVVLPDHAHALANGSGATAGKNGESNGTHPVEDHDGDSPPEISHGTDPVEVPAPDSISILSVGCGDGEVDVEVLRAVAAHESVTKVRRAGDKEVPGKPAYSRTAFAPPSPFVSTASRAQVHYVGLEPSASTAAAFKVRLQQARDAGAIGPDVVAFVLQTELDDRPLRGTTAKGFSSKHQFDVVLMINVLHCFRNPYGALQRAMTQTKPGGCVPCA